MNLRTLLTVVAVAAASWATVEVAHAVGDKNKGQLAAYVWAENASGKNPSAPDNYYFAASKAPATITRSAVGVYQVKLGGVGVPGGHAQVTSYGPGPNYCKIVSWGPQGPDQLVNVACFAPNGTPADAQFALAFFN